MKPHQVLKSFGELSIEKLLAANPDPSSANVAEDSSRAAASSRRAPTGAENGGEKSGPVHLRQQAVPSSYSWVHGGLND
jgi:hypothetical protein